MNVTKCSRIIKNNPAKTMLFPVLSRGYANEDILTHTGQKWQADDYRMVRFTNANKLVNNQWAINLIAQQPPIEVEERVTWCDGGSGPEGHPRVYINLDKPGEHSCGYCGLRYFQKPHH